MSVKIGINGFGRIGRLVFRASLGRSDIEVVGVNDPFLDPDYMEYLVKYDTVHGRFDGEVGSRDGVLTVNGKDTAAFAERNPADIKWGECGADYVVESTGVFLTKEKAQGHIDGGAKRVLMSAPSKDDTPMFVMGVNHKSYSSDMQFVSNASCTTNCLATMVKVLHDNFTIEHGLMSTIHSYTGDQQILDRVHSDLRRARAAAMNIIPTTAVMSST